MTCAQFTLGEKAEFFVKERIGNGLTVSQRILDRLNLPQGTITTFAPEYACQSIISLNKSEDYGYGGIFHQGGGRTCVLTWLRQELMQNSNFTVLIEDAVARANDKWIVNDPGRVVTYNEEVYYVVGRDHLDDLESTINGADSGWILNGYVFDSNAPSEWQSKRCLTDKDISSITQSV